ncbi:hypothetical protein GTY80_56085, partial [Amycolatopsis sp. SID8362]|nr:hypothetical protein [Amycolatopsis sp. SID8362]NED49239.1 hypothetical protein [Amycolatopsis sp. SID8362]
WPWLLALGAVAAAIVAVVQVRRPNPLAEQEKPATEPVADTLAGDKPAAVPAEKPVAPKPTPASAEKPVAAPGESAKNGREPAGRGQHKAR